MDINTVSDSSSDYKFTYARNNILSLILILLMILNQFIHQKYSFESDSDLIHDSESIYLLYFRVWFWFYFRFWIDLGTQTHFDSESDSESF